MSHTRTASRPITGRFAPLQLALRAAVDETQHGMIIGTRHDLAELVQSYSPSDAKSFAPQCVEHMTVGLSRVGLASVGVPQLDLGDDVIMIYDARYYRGIPDPIGSAVEACMSEQLDIVETPGVLATSA